MTDDLDFFSASQALAGMEHLDVPALELLYKLECSGEDFYNLLAGAHRQRGRRRAAAAQRP